MVDSTTITQPDFGLRLRTLRTERRMSQRDLAGDTVNPSYISLIESGARVPTLDVAIQLAQTLQVSLVELIAGITAVRVPGRGDDVTGAGDGPHLPAGQADAADAADADAAAAAARAPAGLPTGPTAADRSREAGLVTELLAESSREAGDLADAEARFRGVYDRGRADDAHYVVLETGLALLEIMNRTGDVAGRLEVTEQLTVTTARLAVPEATVRVLVDRAAALRDAGQLRAASVVAERAAAEIRGTALASTVENVRLLGVLVSIRSELDEFGPELEANIEAMLSLADQVGTDAVRGRAHWVAGLALGHGEQVEAAAQHISAAADLLSTPTTTLRDWVRFSLAAATALVDSGGDAEAAQRHLDVARTGLRLVDLPAESAALQLQAARLELGAGNAQAAIDLIDAADPEELVAVDRAARLTVRASALERLGRLADAIFDLREAARLREQAGAFRTSSHLWSEIDRLRSSQPSQPSRSSQRTQS